MIRPYPKVHSLGTYRDIATILDEPCVVQEKIDGSQFSFRVDEEGALHFRSKGVDIDPTSPGMFALALEGVKAVAHKLLPGWVYRGEFLAKPKHNVLAYDRVPKYNIVIWDVETLDGSPVSDATMRDMAEALGLEATPLLGYLPPGSTLADVEKLQPSKSLLGTEAEGVVVKRLSPEPGMHAKVVAARFREVQGTRPARDRTASPAAGLGAKYCPPTRWAKAVAHLRDAGALTGTPKDIGAIIREALRDMEEECGEAIKAELYELAGKEIRNAAIAGLADWYKEELARGPMPEPTDPQSLCTTS